MIDTSNWKRFKLSDLFEVKGGTGLDFGHTSPGNINFVGRTTINNGIQGKVSYTGNKIFEGNCITISQVGTMVALWQMERFVTSQNITVIRNDKCNKMSGLFICTIINNIIKNSNFDYSATIKKSDINNMELILPVTSDGSPDWQYMESYIQNIWDKCEIKFEKREFNHTINFSTWKKFKISDLFEVKACKPYSANQLQAGNTNYVTRTAENNGITGYVNAEGKQLNDGNCITVGAVGYKAFYQANPFIAGTGITSLRHEKISKYSALFICAILNKKINEYSYDNERTYGKVKNEEILLPVTSDGTPDWQYMENFMCNVSNKCIITINGKVIE